MNSINRTYTVRRPLGVSADFFWGDALTNRQYIDVSMKHNNVRMVGSVMTSLGNVFLLLIRLEAILGRATTLNRGSARTIFVNARSWRNLLNLRILKLDVPVVTFHSVRSCLAFTLFGFIVDKAVAGCSVVLGLNILLSCMPFCWWRRTVENMVNQRQVQGHQVTYSGIASSSSL